VGDDVRIYQLEWAMGSVENAVVVGSYLACWACGAIEEDPILAILLGPNGGRLLALGRLILVKWRNIKEEDIVMAAKSRFEEQFGTYYSSRKTIGCNR
jgi:hypothetical protein